MIAVSPMVGPLLNSYQDKQHSLFVKLLRCHLQILKKHFRIVLSFREGSPPPSCLLQVNLSSLIVSGFK